MKRNELLRRAIAATLIIAGTPVLAQTEAGSDSGRTIESIIVTAQKREQNLQDVPIVVTAVSEQLIKDTGVKDIKDLQILTPGLIVTSSSSEASTTARIRGIGTVGDNPGLESSVGIVVDGVYRPRNGVGFGDLGELERIEVLKGPQGTLFGKNTSAGVINVVSKKPSKTFGSEAELTAGNYGDLEGAVSVTGPLSDTVAARLYVAARERDGFLNVNTGPGPRTATDDYNRSFYTGRGQLLITPSDAFEIRLVADYSKRDEYCCAAPQAVLTPSAAVISALNGIVPGSFANPANPFGRVAYSNRSSAQQIEDKGLSMEINWDLDGLGGATLTSVTAWRDWSTVNAQDADFTTVDLLYRNDDGLNGNDFEQKSQEFRLAGETDMFSWLAGAFYAQEDLDSGNTLLFGNNLQEYLQRLLIPTSPATAQALLGLPANAFPGGLGQQDVYQQEAKTWALFTNNSIRFTDSLEATIGVRYTNESKDLDTQYFNQHGGTGCQTLRNRVGAITTGPLAAGANTIYGIGCATYADPIYNNLATSQSFDENEWSGTVKLAYRFNDQFMTYASAARGYKASGFNLDRERNGSPALSQGLPGGASPDTDTRFNKELVDSYELGAKTQWLDNSLSLNTTVFYQDYTDFQLNTFTGLVFVVTSLPQVVSQGVDMDLMWYTPLEQLTLQGGVTYAETEIKDFGTPATLATFSPLRESDTLSFAPKWSGSLSATFEQPFAASKLFRANVGAKYTSEYNTGSNLAPTKLQGSQTLVNARISVGAENEAWALELWSQNLTNREYYQVGFDGTLQGGTVDAFLGAPRTYGVTARFKF